MLNKLKKTNEGFTIIEIMIVLAIAALILLIVFLAVPALQRSQRNTSRKDDAGRIASAINDYVSNNNGALPGATTALWQTGGQCASILSDAGTLSQYTTANDFGCGVLGTGSATNNVNFEVDTGAVTMSAVAGQAMDLVEDAQCPAAAGTAPALQAATNIRQVALMYTVEPSSGNWTWDCIQAE